MSTTDLKMCLSPELQKTPDIKGKKSHGRLSCCFCVLALILIPLGSFAVSYRWFLEERRERVTLFAEHACMQLHFGIIPSLAGDISERDLEAVKEIAFSKRLFPVTVQSFEYWYGTYDVTVVTQDGRHLRLGITDESGETWPFLELRTPVLKDILFLK